MALYKSLLSNRLAIKFFFSHAAADPHRPFLLPGLTIRRPFPAVRAKDGVSGEQGHTGGFKLEVEQLRAAPRAPPAHGGDRAPSRARRSGGRSGARGAGGSRSSGGRRWSEGRRAGGGRSGGGRRRSGVAGPAEAGAAAG